MKTPLFQMSAVLILVTGTAKSAPREWRLSEAEWQTYNERNHKGPGTYAFGYDVDDAASGNVHFRQEERHQNGTVTGSYGLLEPDGNIRIVHYVADHLGYRVMMENSQNHHSSVPSSPGSQYGHKTPDTKVVYPQYFTSMPPPVLGNSYIHVKQRPQYTNSYGPVTFPTYVYKKKPVPFAPVGLFFS